MITLTAICITIAWFKVSLCLTVLLRICVGKLNFLPARFIFLFLLPVTLFIMAIATPICMHLDKSFTPRSWRNRYAVTFTVLFNEVFIYNWE